MILRTWQTLQEVPQRVPKSTRTQFLELMNLMYSMTRQAVAQAEAVAVQAEAVVQAAAVGTLIFLLMTSSKSC